MQIERHRQRIKVSLLSVGFREANPLPEGQHREKEEELILADHSGT